jgi:hypothetical protein
MKTIKYFTILILVFGLSQAGVTEKRRKPIPMSELTNPASPSYVPIPYPKTRKEIIDDLKYAIKVTSPKDGSYIVGTLPQLEIILMNLVEEKSVYKVGPIYKVKTRASGNSGDYTWLILIQDLNGKNVVRVGLYANGLLGSAGDIFPHREKDLSKTDREILDIVSESIEKPVDEKDVKRIERVAFPSSLGDDLDPLWEVTMKNGTVYYYSIQRDCIYEVKEKRQWTKRKDGVLKPYEEVVSYGEEFLPDEIDDKLIILKKYERKKK